MPATEFGLVGKVTHIYRSVGLKYVTFGIRDKLASVGQCDYHVVGTTVSIVLCRSISRKQLFGVD